MYMDTCIHTYIHAYIHTYIRLYIYLSLSLSLSIYIYKYIDVYIYVYIYIHTYIHTHTHILHQESMDFRTCARAACVAGGRIRDTSSRFLPVSASTYTRQPPPAACPPLCTVCLRVHIHAVHG